MSVIVLYHGLVSSVTHISTTVLWMTSVIMVDSATAPCLATAAGKHYTVMLTCKLKGS